MLTFFDFRTLYLQISVLGTRLQTSEHSKKHTTSHLVRGCDEAILRKPFLIHDSNELNPFMFVKAPVYLLEQLLHLLLDLFLGFTQVLTQIDLDPPGNGGDRNIIGGAFKWVFTGTTNPFHRMKHPGNSRTKRYT